MPEASPTTAPRRPARRLLRISLSMLLVLIALVAVWLAWVTNQARRQAEVLEELRKQGCTVEFDYERPRGSPIFNFRRVSGAQSPAPAWLRRVVGEEYFRKVDFVIWWPRLPVQPFQRASSAEENRLADRQFLRRVLALGTVRQLGIFERAVSAQDFADAPGARSLESLQFDGCANVNDETLAVVARLPNLQWLTLRDCPITGRNVGELSKLPALERLSLDCPSVTDEGLPQLNGLPQLKALSIRSPLITDSGLAQLELPQLDHLQINCDQVTDTGIATLARCPGLTQLFLNCGLTDKGLASLAALKNLESVMLADAKGKKNEFSDQALIDFVQAHPALRSLSLEKRHANSGAILNLLLSTPRVRVITLP